MLGTIACTVPEPEQHERISAVLTLADEQELIPPASMTTRDPAVTFGFGEYLAVWADSRELSGSPGLQGLHGAVFSPTTSPVELELGAVFPIAASCPVQDRPAITSATQTHMAVWKQLCGDKENVYGQVVRPAGQPAGPAFFIDRVNLMSDSPPPGVAVASNGSEYLALWDGNGVQARRYSADGVSLTTPAFVMAGRAPAVAFDGTGYLIVSVRSGGVTTNDLYAQRIASDGTPAGAEIEVAHSSSRDEGHSIACTPNVCLVAWRTGLQIRAMRIAPDNTVLDPGGIVIGAVAGTVRLSTATFDGQAFVVAWRTNAEIRGARVAETGTLLESNTLLAAPPTAPENPAIASTGSGHVVLLYDRFVDELFVSRVRARSTAPISPPGDAGPDAAPPPDAPADAGFSDGGIGTDPGISDATTGGTSVFWFLAPLGDPPATFPGTFNDTLRFRLRIAIHEVDCAHQGVVGALVQNVGVIKGTEQYKTTVNVSSAIYQLDHCYRVIPLLDNQQLGYRDVQVRPTGTASTALPGYKKWGLGANTTIAFRIEEGASCTVVPDAVARWRGDNTAEDSVGTADGTFKGTPQFGPGVVGSAAFVFDGTQFVKAAGFEHAGAFSVAFWAKANAIQAINTGVVSSSDTVTSSAALANTFQIDWNGTGGYRFRAGGSTPLNIDIGAASTTQFQHLAVTYDGASTVTVYLDGSRIGTAMWNGPPLVFTAMKIGVNRGESLRYKGSIDDVRVFARVLADSEVASIAADTVCP